jgi:hypothetical protein
VLTGVIGKSVSAFGTNSGAIAGVVNAASSFIARTGVAAGKLALATGTGVNIADIICDANGDAVSTAAISSAGACATVE